MVTTIPEKALEHWISMYLTYRYRSHAGLWWPTKPEDIWIEHLPVWPGKSFKFEVKTATVPVGKACPHPVKIDTNQLCRYLNQPHYLQPLYIFPVCVIPSQLYDVARSKGVDPTEFAFSRINHHPDGVLLGGHFVQWMYVMTAEQVSVALRHPRCPPHTACHSHLSLPLAVPPRRGASPLTLGSGWWMRDFLKKIERCGNNIPQIMALPSANLRPDNHAYTHKELRSLLGDVDPLDEHEPDDLNYFGSDGSGNMILIKRDSLENENQEDEGKIIKSVMCLVHLNRGALDI